MASIPSAFTFNIYEMRKKNFFPVRFMKKLVLKTARSTQNFQHFRKMLPLKKPICCILRWLDIFFLLQRFLVISTPTNSPTHTLFLKTYMNMILLLNFCTNSVKMFLKKRNLKYSEPKRSCYYANMLNTFQYIQDKELFLRAFENILVTKKKGFSRNFAPHKSTPHIVRTYIDMSVSVYHICLCQTFKNFH